jgi:hypothetical protein
MALLGLQPIIATNENKSITAATIKTFLFIIHLTLYDSKFYQNGKIKAKKVRISLK